MGAQCPRGAPKTKDKVGVGSGDGSAAYRTCRLIERWARNELLVSRASMKKYEYSNTKTLDLFIAWRAHREHKPFSESGISQPLTHAYAPAATTSPVCVQLHSTSVHFPQVSSHARSPAKPPCLIWNALSQRSLSRPPDSSVARQSHQTRRSGRSGNNEMITPLRTVILSRGPSNTHASVSK